VELIVANWQPPAELLRLLEAFAGEIADSTDAEVEAASTATAAAARATLAQVLRMRDLIGEALDEPLELKERLLPPDLQAVGELRHRPN
jgi:hypothetical protein